MLWMSKWFRNQTATKMIIDSRTVRGNGLIVFVFFLKLSNAVQSRVALLLQYLRVLLPRRSSRNVTHGTIHVDFLALEKFLATKRNLATLHCVTSASSSFPGRSHV